MHLVPTRQNQKQSIKSKPIVKPVSQVQEAQNKEVVEIFEPKQKPKVKKIVLVNEDTFSNKSKFYSHRRMTIHNESATGRLINIIGFS